MRRTGRAAAHVASAAGLRECPHYCTGASDHQPPYAGACPNPHADTRSRSYSHTGGIAYPDSHTNCYRYTDPLTHPYSNAYVNTYCGTDTHTNTKCLPRCYG